MALEPPPFQESARCDVCKCSFNTFRRRHHCRCCGRTLCHEHSSNQATLPQFGIDTPVRICADCFNNSSRSVRGVPQAPADKVDSVTDGISRLDIDADVGQKFNAASEQPSVAAVSECKCGMPLCICEAPAPSTGVPPLPNTTSTSIPPLQSNSKPKRTEANKVASSNSKASSSSNPGQQSNGPADRPQKDYEISGEGLREAIKNGDIAGVKKLLKEGVDANYHDKQGMSVLHLAAMFNQTLIAFILMESGASLEYKNAQGETPVDCAPATLQYKMRQKMQESSHPL